MDVHASLFTWSQRVRRGPRLSLLGSSPRLPLILYVWYCLELEFGFLIVDIAPDLLEPRFVFLFASRSIFLKQPGTRLLRLCRLQSLRVGLAELQDLEAFRPRRPQWVLDESDGD